MCTLVSQTLLSRSRWTLRRYYPYHRPTEVAVRQIGLTDSRTHGHAHRTRGRSCCELCTRNSSDTHTGFVHVPLTHIKLANVSVTFAGFPNVSLSTTGYTDTLGHVHSQTLLSRTQVSQTLLFTNTGLPNVPVTNASLATPCHALGTRKRSCHNQVSPTFLSRTQDSHRPLSSTQGSQTPLSQKRDSPRLLSSTFGFTVFDGTVPVFTDAAVTNEGFARVRSGTQN